MRSRRRPAERINRARAEGHRCVCIGTTSVRTLETASTEDGLVHAQNGDTGIFIMPGYHFKATDALVTNFHLPQSITHRKASQTLRRARRK